MATIVNNAKYGEGHKVALKSADQLSQKAKDIFKKSGYKPEAIFSIAGKKAKPTKIISLATGTDSILMKDAKNVVVEIVGSATSINGSFNHYAEGGKSGSSKSSTRLLTELKENISMMIFETYFENKKLLTEDQVIEKIGNKKEYYDAVYYESAVKQLNALKPFIKSSGYHYERQDTNKTVKLYTAARMLTKKLNDNWNPADVWMIKKGFDIDKLAGLGDIDAINEGIAKAFKDRQLIPISLKQVTAPTSEAHIIDPASIMEQKLDMDFGFEKVDLSDTFANFIVFTNSGFQARVGYKASATTLSVSIEGRMAGAGYQLGGVDAKWYPKHVSDKYGYTVRGGAGVAETDYDTAKKELKEMFVKYDRLSNTIATYDKAIELFEKGDQLTKDRFANIISYMYSFLMAPKTKFKEHMQYVYYSAKKVAMDNSMYLILQ
jgi:hypothetical protein